jgi:NADPH-dependent 2,4-dienoyl-CoA reductase/sulfur reductase-like enzyme
VTQRYRNEGVRVLAGDSVVGVERDGDLRVSTRSGETFQVDGVVAGLGIEPNVALAQDAGLDVDDGIVVDARLQTSADGIYAAGDVANFEAPGLGRMRVEHEDNANTMGAAAGAIMAGADTKYEHLPFFYSDLFDMGYEAVGRLHRDLDTVEDWHDGFDQGVVYYLDNGKVHGVLLWNVWGQVDAARELIAGGDSYAPTQPAPCAPVRAAPRGRAATR